MILKNLYSVIFNIDNADWKWCNKRGVWCDKDSFGFECSFCNRR